MDTLQQFSKFKFQITIIREGKLLKGKKFGGICVNTQKMKRKDENRNEEM